MKPNTPLSQPGSFPHSRISSPPKSTAQEQRDLEGEAFFRELYAAETAVQRCQRSPEHERVARRIFDFLRDTK